MSTGCTLVLAPMQVELAPIVRRGRLRRDRRSGAHVGTIGTTPVVAVRIGVGPVEARRRTEAALAAHDPVRAIVVGVAGGVAPTTRIGDLVVPEEVLDLDTGARHRPEPLPGATPGGVLATSAELLSHEEIYARGPGALVAIDMETAAVAEVCTAHDVAWSVIRAVSDLTRDGEVGDQTLALVRPDGRTDVVAALRALARHPGAVRRFAVLARGSATATRRATDALAAALAPPGPSPTP